MADIAELASRRRKIRSKKLAQLFEESEDSNQPGDVSEQGSNDVSKRRSNDSKFVIVIDNS